MSSDDDNISDYEPVLKYNRIQGIVPQLIRDGSDGLADKVSVVKVHKDFILLGTFDGAVLQLDLEGNLIRRNQQHRDRVTDISIDLHGGAFASCSEDGRVVIYSNPQNESQNASDVKPVVHTFYHSIRSVAIDPNYSKQRDYVFVCGGVSGKLIMKKKGWFSSSESEIHKGEGIISCITWRGDLIAWANDTGIKIYDYSLEQRIAFIEKPSDFTGRWNFRCYMIWENDDTILIGWANTIKILTVSQRKFITDINAPMAKCVEISSCYELTDCYVCGVSPFRSQELAVLAYPLPEDANTIEDAEELDEIDGVIQGKYIIYRPELRIINRGDGDEVSSETLPIRLFELNKPIDYSLSSCHESIVGADGKPLLYIVAPKDVVLATPRDLDDHISWAIDEGNFEKALSMATSAPANSLKLHNVRTLEDKLLNDLLLNQNFEQAVTLCSRILGEDRDRWVQWASKFEGVQALHEMAFILPVANPQLPSEVYESVLLDFLGKRKFEMMLKLIRQWQRDLYQHVKSTIHTKDSDLEDSTDMEMVKVPQLYNLKMIIDRVNSVVCELGGGSSKQKEYLRDILAELYGADNQFDMALREYLERPVESLDVSPERAEFVFGLIERHGLLHSVQDKVQSLIHLDMERAVAMFVNAVITQEVVDDPTRSSTHLIGSIVTQLGGNLVTGTLSNKVDLKPLYMFMHNLFRRRAEEFNNERMSVFQDLQVQVFAKFDRQCLQDFLDSASYYSLDKALQVCEKHEPVPLYQEIVFILARMGGAENIQKALHLILKELRNVPMAIEFVVKEGDTTMWEDLVKRCATDPALIGDLLLEMGAHNVNPADLINMVPDDMRVPELSTKLGKLFLDVELQKTMRESCSNILKKDISELLMQLIRRRRRGVALDGRSLCAFCHLPLYDLSLRKPSPSLVVTGSGYAYHQTCIAKAPVGQNLRSKDIHAARYRSLLKEKQVKH